MATLHVENPVIKGFNPDPSVIRVGHDDYYLATSTFQWFPGVQIFHSKDVVNWTLIAHPLDEKRLLDMKGDADGGGVWAPCLSYKDGTFYLVYSDMKTDESSAWKDCHNYVIYAHDILGPWSDPIYLNSSGFDPSIFHDDDGKTYILNVVRDHRINHHWSLGIFMQELSLTARKLIGTPQCIYKGSILGKTEGPNLYKVGKYYYLFCAAGGTEYGHSEVVARSENLFGPYEEHPNENGILITAFGAPSQRLQKMGHTSLIKAHNDKWYITHLTSRPFEVGKLPLFDLAQNGHCPLGRETALQEIYWEHDWPYVVGGIHGRESFEIEGIEAGATDTTWPVRLNFNEDIFVGDKPSKLNINLQSMRIPLDKSLISTTDRPGFLRLYGHESLASPHTVALVARRWQSLNFDAQTALEFRPHSFQQAAGLVCMYDRFNFTFIFISHDENKGRCIDMFCRKNKNFYAPLAEVLPIDDAIASVSFKVEVRGDKYQYLYSLDGDKTFTPIGPKFSSLELSDDFIQRTIGRGYFTGAFVGLACMDMQGEHLAADFAYFEYKEH